VEYALRIDEEILNILNTNEAKVWEKFASISSYINYHIKTNV